MDHDPTSSPGASSHWLRKGAALMGILLLAAAIVFWAVPLWEKKRAQKILDRHFTWSQSERKAEIKPMKDGGQELVGLDAKTVWALSVMGTRSLDLWYCDNLRNLAALKSLPTLVSLDLIRCTGLTAVDALPAGLQTLYLIGCTGLTAVDTLPAGLQRLTLAGCTGLTTVDALPAGLKSLNLIGCTALERVGALPAGLKVVWMRDTPKLPEAVKAEIRAIVKKNGGEVDG